MMKFVLLLAACGLLGCSNNTAPPGPRAGPNARADQPLPPEAAEQLKEMAATQAAALKDAKITVHRAYNYDGYSSLEAVDDAKLIAVDVEFGGTKEGFDLDHVHIVEGDSDENFGNNPEIAFLTSEGEVPPIDDDGGASSGDQETLRVLLIYAVPKGCQSIKLRYWGQELTPEAIKLTGTGPKLPPPAAPARPRAT